MLSVIIPTHNRKEILSKCIKSLESQSIPVNQYELVIINDGSTDDTESYMEPILRKSPLSIRFINQPNNGPATARNLGIREAKGELVLIIGDDIIASSNLLEEHLQFHIKYRDENISVLGYTTWSPELSVTPFMYWLEHGGPQFAYDSIRDKIEIKENIVFYFYTSNVSLKKSFILKNGFFDEDFPYAAFEDTEFAYRLQKKGLRLFYNKNAIAYHHHPMTMDSVSQRMERVGLSMHTLFEKQPDLIPVIQSIFPPPSIKLSIKLFIQKCQYPFASRFNQQDRIHLYWGNLMRDYLWKGYRQGIGKS